MSLKNCLIVLWVYIMYVLGIWLFLSGYLLKRIVIYQNSTSVVNFASFISCHDVSSVHNISDEFIRALNTASVEDEQKSNLKRFEKVVMIIIDALRHDFVQSSTKSKHEEFYLNKMPVFKKLIKKSPNNALLLPLFADPPTTTLQRLKGLTTGSLPTFIDISLNFASSEITEDSFIRQMNRFKKNIIFMGDDTWDSIFPNQFNRSFSYPSFNVKDLDSVDNGILDHIYEELEKSSNDVLIAHFLGVDHCGHRYGPKHPEMARKLSQMNNVIQKVSEVLHNDTILIVLGDHGMTDSGDHGGDSTKETSTALFLYSPTRIVFDNTVHSLIAAAQVDIVPTLSLLLGLPIPFSNLGSVMPQLFTLNSNNYCFHDELDALLGGALATAENALQIHRYLKAYSSVSSEFDNSFVRTSEERLKNISYLWRNISSNVTYSKEIISEIKNNYKEYTLYVRSLCEKKWATFNHELMIIGLLILGFTMSCNLWIAEKVNSRCFIIIPTAVLFIFLHVSLYMFCSFHLWLPVALIVSCIFIKFVNLFYEDFIECFQNLMNVPSLFLILLFLSSFSNSFVVYEDHVILYLLQSIILYRFHPCLINLFKHNFQAVKGKTLKRNQKIKYVEPLLLVCLMICIRIGLAFFKCREEQIPCENTNFVSSLEKLHMPQSYKVFRLFISLASIIIPTIVFLCLSNYKNSTKFRTATAVSIRYGVFFVCVLTSLRWWLNIVSPEAVERILEGNEVVLTRSASFISITMCIVILLFPILVEKPWTIPSKEIYGESLGTFLFIISQLLYLIAGDATSSSVTLMSSSILLHVILADLSTTVESQMWIDVLSWNLLSRHWFYASAHQATFTSIQWDAAFLFHHKEIYSYVLSGALVVLNTFSANVLFGLAFPAILIWSQPTTCSAISISRLHMKYLFCSGVKLLGHVIASVILRRHLMVWKVFSPRLLYEVLGIIITMVSSCISHYFIVTVTSQYHKLIRNNLSHMFSNKDQ